MPANTNKTQQVKVVEVVRTGDKLILPEKLSFDEAIQQLQFQRDYEEQDCEVHCKIPCFLLEGAWAFYQACIDAFGWVRNVKVPAESWFDKDRLPSMLTVPVSRHETVQVPWGRIHLPVVQGWLECGVTRDQGRLVFMIHGQVKRKFEGTVQSLFKETQRRVREDSLYKGTAFRIRWKDDEGDAIPVPEPRFVNLDHAPHPEELIFREEVRIQIETNIFTLITKTEQVKAAGVPLKRGVLLTGRYGTGKTMAVTCTARLCEEHGWTFIECERADELAEVLKLAQQYGRTCVFCEDIDQVLAGERDLDMNQILNVIDGLDAKSSEVLVVLTTNHVDKITQAMIRPGRLDAVIDMKAPDAAAAERLLRMYGRGLIPADEDLAEVGRLLEDQIPSLIREVCEGAKLYALSLSPDGKVEITARALISSAQQKQTQMALLQERKPDTRSDMEKAAAIRSEGLYALAAELKAYREDGRPAPVDGAVPALMAAVGEST